MGLLKTKYDNQDKLSILSEVKYEAEQKRRDAHILIKQAESIEEITRKLDIVLEDVEP